MTYLFEILLLIANIAMAEYHVYLFRQGKKVKHGWWGMAYVTFAGLLSLLTHSWWLVAASLLLRKLAFDIALNLFEGFKWNRVSYETTSIIDKLHNKLFGGRAEIYEPIYFVILVLINIFWI
jgi:hypothetical protein